MKVAIIHYWLVNMRGGEKVLEAICELFPQADIYTHVYVPNKMSETIRKHNVFTTFIQKLPRAHKWYQRYLPLMPRALEALDLSHYDLIISSESGPAKGILTPSHIPHICYCHTPMRYLWDYYHHYLHTSGFITRFFFSCLAPSLRNWDVLTSHRVDTFIANSHNVAKRIQRIYRRESSVIHPPVDLPPIEETLTAKKESFYLFLGQVTSYKRADLAIETFRQNGLSLIIAGGGDLLKNLPKNIQSLGFVSDTKRKELLLQAKALIFPGEEDFGIVPLEAIAHGTPVIAYARGGALETVIPNLSGILFEDQTVASLQSAIDLMEQSTYSFNKEKMYHHAEKFSKQRFQREFSFAIQQTITAHPL
ncbi:glycosyltransferase [Entomospira entomophila]|uniref:Glycosyltransferase family 4 protein n=1 Tax=Entomospira entomophila TaxID=2719988 RepID=A0A968GCT9_9SPIO|nr:glycosyltransferase [Entomospira entomophilus]NIZ40614.1 glycosyltransferase family 4 protein [Entomospira entomophilus]WDI34829.1 glycosyltransferase [Entomospira entomophilus]